MSRVAPITALTMVALLPIYITLAFRVIKKRRQHQVALGSGKQSDLESSIRAHSNFSEYVPFFLMLILGAEINAAPAWLIAVCSLFFADDCGEINSCRSNSSGKHQSKSNRHAVNIFFHDIGSYRQSFALQWEAI